MDKILLNNMAFYGYHGVFSEEKTLGQKFFVDLVLKLDLKEAGRSDDLHKSINYGEVYNIVKEIVEERRFKLIEALAETISSTLFTEYSTLEEAQVRIKKPEAPVPGIYDYFGVEITRRRDESNNS